MTNNIETISNYYLFEINNESTYHKMNGETVPKISLENYIKRLVRLSTAWIEEDIRVNNNLNLLLITLIYYKRIKRANESFSLNWFNVHRFVAVSYLAAFKYHEDNTPDNNVYSNISGIELQELNDLENEFYKLIQFHVHVDKIN